MSDPSEAWFPVPEGTYVWTSAYGYRKDPLGRVTSEQFHGGVDVAPKVPGRKLPTSAIISGTFTLAGFEQYGAGNNWWIINGKFWWKAFHNDTISGRTGQQVTAGEQVSIMGTTGASTGVHGHYELWINGIRVDPTPYLQAAERAGRFPGVFIPTPTIPSVPSSEDFIMATRDELRADLADALKPIATRLTVIEAMCQAIAGSSYLARDERDGAIYLVTANVKRHVPEPSQVDVLKTFVRDAGDLAATLEALPTEAWAA